MSSSLLADFSWYGIGGTCDYLFQPESQAELVEFLRRNQLSQHDVLLLGKGSNTLVSDVHWPGAAILFHKMKKLQQLSETVIYADAGVDNSDFSEFALSKSLDGAGWMKGLPGQMGGTVRMNARCYGGEMSQIVTKVLSVDLEGNIKARESSQGLFRGYKDTVFMTNAEIITGVEIELSPVTSTEKLRHQMNRCYEDRKSKHQYDFPTCGCVFKNDYREDVCVPSGLLIEEAGCKGLKVGGAQVSPHHANFILNQGACFIDVLELSLRVRDKVWQKFGVWLQYEMEILGKIPPDLQLQLAEERQESFNVLELEKLRAQFNSRN